MPIDPEIFDHLFEFRKNVEKWRTEAKRIGQLADGAGTPGHIADIHLLDTSGEIYTEIAALNALVSNVAATSPNAATRLAEVRDALQLVLLEITELGTRMHSARAIESQAPAPILSAVAGGRPNSRP